MRHSSWLPDAHLLGLGCRHRQWGDDVMTPDPETTAVVDAPRACSDALTPAGDARRTFLLRAAGATPAAAGLPAAAKQAPAQEPKGALPLLAQIGFVPTERRRATRTGASVQRRGRGA